MAIFEPVKENSYGPPWFAVQVRSTHENRVASLFDCQGYERFLPLYIERRRWSDRIKCVEAPLFPGYVFCRVAPSHRVSVLKTPGVVRIVGVGLTPAPIDKNEIEALQRVTESGHGIVPHPFMQVGQRVRIVGGSLDGLEGLIADVRQHDRLILSVSLLQRSVAVEIHSACVVPIHTSSTRTSPQNPIQPRKNLLV